MSERHQIEQERSQQIARRETINNRDRDQREQREQRERQQYARSQRGILEASNN